MIKNLVVNLSTGKDEDGARDYAISLARELDAHLAAVAFAYEPIPAATLIGDASGEWLDELRQDAEEAANAAIERFNAAVRGSGILAEARALTTTMTGAADLFGRIARRFDLAVVRQAEPDKDGADPLIIEAALFDSGRPVLIVPYIHRGGVKLARIMVCWDGSRGAARAIGDAMPLLERANAVEVVIVGPRAGKSQAPTSPSISPGTAPTPKSRRSSRPTWTRPTSSCPMQPIHLRTSSSWAAMAIRGFASLCSEASRGAFSPV